MKNILIIIFNVAIFSIFKYINVIIAFLAGFATTNDMELAKLVGRYMHHPSFLIQEMILIYLWLKTDKRVFLLSFIVIAFLFLLREFDLIPDNSVF
jgi:hypothetical protein